MFDAFVDELEKSAAGLNTPPDLASAGLDMRIRHPHNPAVKRQAYTPPKQSIRPAAKALQRAGSVGKPTLPTPKSVENYRAATSPLPK
jgi:hypothetical protein